MALVEQIEGYLLAWNQQHGCEVRLKVKGDSKTRTIKVAADELAAIAAILREDPVFLENGWIHTGPEPITE